MVITVSSEEQYCEVQGKRGEEEVATQSTEAAVSMWSQCQEKDI